ncbi:uncharacterized protein C5orf34 homolog isoform X2 [Hemicordylus capensis]|uniref:uncharacterized protein C5orf34 homolog isoform X2 n=1 Tax=Hemicordylus capensis TaxID=884348 RepID=UPI002302D9C7|nr:uncharacterized protein C5orf34 homolog isoform X2 [Hemicordylus capensis]
MFAQQQAVRRGAATGTELMVLNFLHVAMELETCMILHEDNSVEVYYVDGSRLLLAPCGSEFLYEQAAPISAHPLQPPERVRQRTEFAISIYREQLLRAVDFRNQYANRPYLPSGIMPPNRKNVLFTDICEAQWPGPETASEVINMHNGNVKITSLDGHACLCLPELQQEFTVEFLCKVSQKLSAPLSLLENHYSESTQDRCGRSSQDSTLKPSSEHLKIKKNSSLCGNADSCTHVSKSGSSSSQTQKENEIPWSFQSCSSEYSRVTQHISVSSCPEQWKYPLSLAFTFYRSHIGHVAESDEGNKGSGNAGVGDVFNEPEKSRTVTCLPLALPLSCHASYLHRWTFCDLVQPRKEDIGCYSHSQPIKVVWSKGVIYRFLTGSRSIEIYPGDGSVFRSEGLFLGKYFTRYSIQEGTKQREETMYSVSSLPPDTPGSLYSVSATITQAMRILQHSLETMLSFTHHGSDCCWNLSPKTGGGEMLPVLVAEKVIPNVGRLLAYSDNKVHAAFYDGMILNMLWDFSSLSGISQRPQDGNIGWCKLIAPEGTQHLLQIDHPGLYERYIETVVEWCRSLNRGRERCTDIPQSIPEGNWSVADELEKIKRFNFLVENSNIPRMVSPVKTNPSSNIDNERSLEEIFLAGDISKKNIAETLEKTSKIINDIDSILALSAN